MDDISVDLESVVGGGVILVIVSVLIGVKGVL